MQYNLHSIQYILYTGVNFGGHKSSDTPAKGSISDFSCWD